MQSEKKFINYYETILKTKKRQNTLQKNQKVKLKSLERKLKAQNNSRNSPQDKAVQSIQQTANQKEKIKQISYRSIKLTFLQLRNLHFIYINLLNQYNKSEEGKKKLEKQLECQIVLKQYDNDQVKQKQVIVNEKRTIVNQQYSHPSQSGNNFLQCQISLTQRYIISMLLIMLTLYSGKIHIEYLLLQSLLFISEKNLKF